MNPRRLVLCLDGTWNNAYSVKMRDDGHEVLKPSNVLKTARAVMPLDVAHDRQQIVYYDVGVGSLVRYPGVSNRLLAAVDKTLGGGWGAGFEENVEEALSFLALNHEPADEVFVFGFSRGAATARAVVQFLDWADGLPVKNDAYYLPRLFREYIGSRGSERFATVLARINKQRIQERRPLAPLASFQPVDVVFLGVWDTVLALGRRFVPTAARSFHVGKQPPSCVRHARQALAIDEVRADFRPEIWNSPAGPQQTLEQRWFAGVHSNVGGGYVDDGLANVAFRWMLREAGSQGLAVSDEYVKRYRPYAQDHLYRSESLLYRTFDAVRWRAGRGRRSLVCSPASAAFTLDPSVVVRIQADPKAEKPGRAGELEHPGLRTLYRPDNAIDFLAEQPDAPSYLRSIGVNDPTLPDDVVERLAKTRNRKRRGSGHPGRR